MNISLSNIYICNIAIIFFEIFYAQALSELLKHFNCFTIVTLKFVFINISTFGIAMKNSNISYSSVTT